MSCCSEIIQIIEGTTKQILRIKPKFYNKRFKICESCPENTYMSRREYLDWLLHNGISFKRLHKFLEDLPKLPKLPKHKKSDKRKIFFCRICKCDLYKKIIVKDAKCTLGKW